MSVSPDRRVLYVGTRGEPKAAAGFAIDPSSGKLKYIASGPLADSLAYIAVDRTGRFLLGASYPGHRVTVNPIGSPGKVSPPQQVLENYPNAHAIFADPANRFVLVPTLGNDRVNQFAFDAATGRLTPTTSPAVEARPKAGPRHFVYHPGGKLVYVIGELDGAVYVFDYNAATRRSEAEAGRQRAAARLPGQALGRRSAHHAQRQVPLRLGARRRAPWPASRSTRPRGTLTPIGSVPTEKQPRGFAIDPSGRYLLAVGQLSHGLSSYAIDQSTGKLTKLKEYPMGKNPNWVEILDLP